MNTVAMVATGGAAHYRDARIEDIPMMVGVFRAAVADMFARNNVQTPIPPPQAVAAAYEHVCRTGQFRVAEVDGRIVAITGAILRGSLWYLSAFWVLPEYQNHRIGMPLLRQVWEAGVAQGARKFFTWSSVDITAMAAYMKLGMLPGYQILLFEGVRQDLPMVPRGLVTAPLEPEVAMTLDQSIRGTRREADHALWSALSGRQVLCDGETVGYYYTNHGSIGPAAWTEPGVATAILTFACGDAAANSNRVRLAIPGINHDALRFAFKTGLRLSGNAHFLASAPFGCMERYLPSGPSLY